MTEYTLGFIFTSDYKQVLLIKRGNHAFHSHKHNGLGGKITIGESPKECIAREVEEETTILTKEDDWNFAGVLTAPQWKVWVFCTTIKEKTFEQHENPEGIVSWVGTDSIPRSAVSNLRWIIPFCIDKLTHPELTSFVVWYSNNLEGS